MFEGVSITYSRRGELITIGIERTHSERFDDIYQVTYDAMHDETLTPEELAVEAHHKEIGRKRRAERANLSAS